MYIPALDIDYWKNHYDIKSLHNLERLIKFYRAKVLEILIILKDII